VSRAFLAAFLATAISGLALPAFADAPALYTQHCVVCHGADRLGGMGPALLPENLERLRQSDAAEVIRSGRPATQMPGFGSKLTGPEIESLVRLAYTPLGDVPDWNFAAMRASRVVHVAADRLPARPVYKADELNLFVVVELGDHHLTVLDGDRLEPLARVPTRFALHGGPKFSPDGRFVYLASRDGWVSKFDLYSLQTVVEIRAGINTRNLAVSSDGRYVAVGNYLPHSIVMLDAGDLQPLQVIDVRGQDGKASRVSAVYAAEPRRSFIAALKDIPEVWEIAYDPAAPAIREAARDDQATQVPGLSAPFSLRRIRLAAILDDFNFDQGYAHIIGAARDGSGGQVVDLDAGAKVAAVDLPGLPHLASGITWRRGRDTVFATPNLQQGVVSVINMENWKTIKRIETLGPGFFMRSHERTCCVWVDNSMSPHKDTIQLIDKQTLEIVKSLTPAPGRTAAHVEFTRDGRYALVSIAEMDGALVIYDAATFREVKRLPMKKPSGKYNVYNKITRSEGTSH
jgi:hypothetical protein